MKAHNRFNALREHDMEVDASVRDSGYESVDEEGDEMMQMLFTRLV